jgi:WD40 repeat protein/tetratricopeptide (TPR) repeat protein
MAMPFAVGAWTVAFSPDSRRVVTAQENHVAIVWDAATGQQLAAIAHGNNVVDASFSPDGTRGASASHDRTVRVWDAATGALVVPILKHDELVDRVLFRPDGRYLLTITRSGTARLWDAATGEPATPALKHWGPVRAACFSPDGRRVVTACRNEARVWDLPFAEGRAEDLMRLAQFLANERVQAGGEARGLLPLTTAELHRDWEELRSSALPALTGRGRQAEAERWAASLAHWDRLLAAEPQLWQAYAMRGHAHAELGRWDRAATDFAAAAEQEAEDSSVGASWALACLAGEDVEGYRRACAFLLRRFGASENADVINTATWPCVLGPDAVADLGPAADRAAMAAGFQRDSYRHARTCGAALFRAGRFEAAAVQLRHAASLLAYSPTTWSLLAMTEHCLGHDAEARRWLDRVVSRVPPRGLNLLWTERLTLELLRREADDLLAGRVRGPRPAPPDGSLPFRGHREPASCVVFSPDGRRVLSSGWDKTLILWDRATRKELARFEGHTGFVFALAFSPDGRQVVSGGSDRVVRLWDVVGAKELRRFKGHTGDIWGIAFAQKGPRAASAGTDGTVRLWDTDSGKELRRFLGHTGTVAGIAFSPDGRHLLSSGYDRTVRLWEAETGQEVRRFEGHADVIRSVAFSPDGRRFLSGSHDRTLRLWDLEGNGEVRRLEGHTHGIISVAFSPDGRRAVSGGYDLTVRLWDLESGAELCSFPGHSGFIHGVAYSPDGRFAASAAWDNTVRLWPLPPQGQPPAGKER